VLAWAAVEAPDHGWSSGATLGRAALSLLLLAAVVARAAYTPRTRVPVLPLPLPRTRTYALTCSAGLTFFMAFGAMLLGNVLWLTGGWGMSPLEAGLLLVPGPTLAALFAVPGGRLGARFGCGQVAAVGMTLFAVGTSWWLWRVGVEQEYVTGMLPGLLATGMGVGLTMTNLSAAVSSTLPPSALATGTATFSAARQLGATFGVALLLGLVTGQDALEGAQRGWVLVVVVSALAAVTARFVGRAQPPDLARRHDEHRTASHRTRSRPRAHLRLDGTGVGIRRSAITVDPSLWSWTGPHGGVLAAIALDAAAEVVHADLVPQV
jgi:MFS family permease